jgi:hypothetical protein
MRALRRVGDIMIDMEKLLLELHVDHDLQHGEVLYLINGWQKLHVPDQVEEYEDDDSHPCLHPAFESIYGPFEK